MGWLLGVVLSSLLWVQSPEGDSVIDRVIGWLSSLFA